MNSVRKWIVTKALSLPGLMEGYAYIGSDKVIRSVTSTPVYTLPVATADILGGIKAGENTSISSDGTLNVTIPAQDVPVVTTSQNGLMLSSDKVKLDGMSGSTYVLPEATESTLGGVKVSVVTSLPASQLENCFYFVIES